MASQLEETAVSIGMYHLIPLIRKANLDMKENT